MSAIDDIVQLSYSYFALHKATPETIKVFITRMKAAFPEDAIDDDGLFANLENLHSVTILGSLSSLDEVEGHEEWFNPSTNIPINRTFEWQWWAHLKQYLIAHKKRTSNIVDSLDTISSEILSRLEDPHRPGSWDRRGMVMGSVQSGKTANFTALACKAIDAGYRMVIILAGIHNSLRSQTQERINEEILGYDLDRVQRLTGDEKRTGVGMVFPDHKVVNTLTSSAPKGDFNRTIANQAGIIPSPTGDPIILVVKKRVSTLGHLYRWLSSLPGTNKINRRTVLTDIPLLMIDDECDLASVNTNAPEYDQDGKILEDWDPTKTNQEIRKILYLFQKSAYVGYTATPYANIFIHKDDFHPKYGDDLFPKHFIVSIPQPSNYIGPEKLFGMAEDSDSGINKVEPLPLFREVNDHSNDIPDTHRSTLQISKLPGSLQQALKGYLLVCSVRRIRKSGIPHNSMLIHVTKYNAVQKQVKELVESALRTLVARIQSGTDSLSDLKELWETDFINSTEKMRGLNFPEAIPIKWDEVKKQLYEAAKYIKVKGINGEIGDILDYREHEALVRQRILRGEQVSWTEQGISVIAIGGDKLSRGLTLDGLSVSYYLRSTKMYDTLMQMGRWFGYRDGYNDLCRIYTTQELAGWYKHIALANQELRNQLEYMAAINKKPENFRLKVRSHSGRLAVTSAGKSRHAEVLSISFAGEFPKTIVFDPRYSEINRQALNTLINSLGTNFRPIDPRKPRYHWESADSTPVLAFLRSYITQESAKRVVNPNRIADFIERQNHDGELDEWHVVIVSTNDPNNRYKYGNFNIGCCRRIPDSISSDRISIGTLTSPSDEALDLSNEEMDKALDFDRNRGKIRTDGFPTSIAIRHARPKTRGLLLIYLPSCTDVDNSYGLAGEEVVGFAISFPQSDTATPIDYWAGPVYEEE